MPSLQECLHAIESNFEQLGPELQRCARWAADHPREVGLLSMRQQAQQVGATPTSMVRMAKALGFESYADFRQPFQDAIASPVPSFRDLAKSMQTADTAGKGKALNAELENMQLANVRSVSALNKPADLDAAVKLMLGAKRVAFLGIRSCFAISYHFHYAYGLIATNGLLVHGLGGAFPDQVDMLDDADLLVCITQQPYGRPTIEAVKACHARGIDIITLTDSKLSPAVAFSKRSLFFKPDSPSFFPSMVGPLALVEQLLARAASHGGQPVLDRLAEVESRLHSSNAYWTARSSRKKS